MLLAEDYQLGFDDTIVRRPNLDTYGSTQYDIEVNGTWYCTQRLVSSIGADTIRGRGTQVWEVKELDENKVEMPRFLILKDSWANEERTSLREELIHREILETNDLDDQSFQILHRSLLTCLNAWDVTVETPSGREPDTTCPIMLRGRDSTYGPHREKIHHRIIFAEVGTTILEVHSLYSAFQYLAQVALGAYIPRMEVIHWLNTLDRALRSASIWLGPLRRQRWQHYRP